MKKIAAIAAALAVTAVLASCSDGEKKSSVGGEYERGSMNDGVYTSEWAGFEIEIPEEMYCFTDAEINDLMGLGADILTDGDGDSTMDYIEQTSVYEFYAMDYNSGEVLFMTTEKMPTADFSEEDYAMSMKSQLENVAADGVTAECADSCVKANYGGTEFEKYEIVISVSGFEMYQTYLLKNIDGRMVAVCAGAASRESVEELLGGIQKLG